MHDELQISISISAGRGAWLANYCELPLISWNGLWVVLLGMADKTAMVMLLGR